MKKQIWIVATAMLALSGCDEGGAVSQDEVAQSVDRIAESDEVGSDTLPSVNDATNDVEKLQQLVAASQCLGVAKANAEFWSDQNSVAEFWSENSDAEIPENSDVANTMLRAISAYLQNTSKPQQFKQSESNALAAEYKEKVKYVIKNYSSLSDDEIMNINNLQKDCSAFFENIVYLPETYGSLD